jgi:hypothetical protein
MPILFFMPWATTRESFCVAGLTFMPYRRGTSPGDQPCITQHQLDAILGNYGERQYGATPERQVANAVLLHWAGSAFGGDATTEEVQSRLSDLEMITVSALSERTFGAHIRYTNSDEVAVIAQGFDPARPSALSTATRRRDGGVGHGFGSGGGIKFQRPLHVAATVILDLDKLLLESLLTLKSSGQLPPHLYDAISVFNRANTDADGISDKVDLVLHRVALETLAQATHRTADLKAKLTNLLGLDAAPVKWWPGDFDRSVWTARWPKSMRPFDAWVEDFCHARNVSAHGTYGASSRAPAVWSERNHLMFASWLFPLLAKKVLAESGAHPLSEEDQDYLRDVEIFLAHDISQWDADHRQKWSEVEEHFTLEKIARALRRGS